MGQTSVEVGERVIATSNACSGFLILKTVDNRMCDIWKAPEDRDYVREMSLRLEFNHLPILGDQYSTTPQAAQRLRLDLTQQTLFNISMSLYHYSRLCSIWIYYRDI